MEKINTNLLIIGAGPGGYVAAIHAAKNGLNVTLVDSLKVGGVCLNEGCIPTKALVKSAELYQEMLNSEKEGIQFKEISFDINKIIDNKDIVKDKLVNGVIYLLNKYGVNLINGYAKFVDDNLVEVFGEEKYLVKADNIIIATGAKPKHLTIPGINSKYVVNSEYLLSNKKLPKVLNIIGGGVIGMEFAFIYAGLGVKVNVIEFLPNILPTIDKELSVRLNRYAKKLNISIFTNSAVTNIEEKNDGVIVHYQRKNKLSSLECDLVLEAVGRIPAVDGFNLEKTSINFDKFGIKVNKRMRSNIKNIYAIGDVTNIIQLAHVASHQGLIAVDNILGLDKEMNYDAIPAVIFTTPIIATVGKTEDYCKKNEIPYEVVKVPYSANGKALIMGAEAGYYKLIRNPLTKVLIGAMVFGKDADNLIGPIGILITNKRTVKDLQETVFAHPTIQELLFEGAMGLDKQAIHFID